MKELPYFKFYVSEWSNGNITLCSYEAQGLFINLCSLYWSQSGCVRIADAKRRHSGCTATAWKQLISEQIIKVEKDMLIINFLDEQFCERKKLSNQNRLNALEKHKKQATAQRWHSDRTAMACNIEEKREEEKREEYTNENCFKTKEEAFETIKLNDIRIEELRLILSGRDWRDANQIDILALLKHFLNSKANLESPQNEVYRHLRNWLGSPSTKIEDLKTLSQVFKKTLTNGRT
jgi:hypothetical protein